MARHWALFPTYLVRSSGFSFERIERLRFDASLAAMGRLSHARLRSDAAGAEVVRLLDDLRYDEHPAFSDPTTHNKRRKLVRKVRTYALDATRPPPDAALGALTELLSEATAALAVLSDRRRALAMEQEAFERTFQEELSARRRELADCFETDPRLLEAVFMQSPKAHAGLSALLARHDPARTSKTKGRERTAVGYLQRFCAKNDTNSMCGPVGFGVVEAGDADASFDLEGLGARRVYFSKWAAEALREALSRRAFGVEGALIRRNPTGRLEGGRLSWCRIQHDATTFFERRYAAVEASPEIRAVWERLSRPLRLHALSEQEQELAEELLDAGALLDAPALPFGSFDPLADLSAEVQTWSAPEASAAVGEIDQLVRRFETSAYPERIHALENLNERFEAIAGTPAIRNEGAHYADRALVHEDCAATLSARFSEAEATTLVGRLEPLLSAVSLPLEIARENVRAWFDTRFKGAGPVPALEVHRAFDKERPYVGASGTERHRALQRALDSIRSVMAAAVAGAEDNVARISAGAIRDHLPELSRPAYASADLMLARGESGATTYVLGEMHGFFMLPTFWFDVAPTSFANEAMEGLRSCMRSLAGGRRTAEALFIHTQATNRRHGIADGDLAVVSFGDREDEIPFGSLDVTLAEDGIRFEVDGAEVVPLMTYETYPFLLYTSPLAPIVDEFTGKFPPADLLPAGLAGADAPRLILQDDTDGAGGRGDIVFRRATWVRSARDLVDALESTGDERLFVRAQGLKETLGCPRCVFYSCPGEPKPILLDFESFFLVESFARTVRALKGDEEVKLSEMLPGPTDLLLSAPDGRRTSELRIGLYRPS